MEPESASEADQFEDCLSSFGENEDEVDAISAICEAKNEVLRKLLEGGDEEEEVWKKYLGFLFIKIIIRN